MLTIGAASLLLAGAGTGLMKIFVDTRSGGVVARRLLAAVVVLSPITILLAHLIIIGAGENSMYDSTAAAGMLAGLAVFMVLACIIWVTRKMSVIESKQLKAEEKVELLSGSLASMSGPAALKRVCLHCAREFPDTDVDHCPEDGTRLELVAEGMKPGARFANKYEIVRTLGSGGICTVYLVRHLLIDKQYALKLLRSQFAADAKYLQRFQREANAMSKLSHPNIAAVNVFGVSRDGQAYLVMEYLEGQSLDDFGKNGPVPWRQAVPIFQDICEGLLHAHSNGVVHRDLKPANVMLVEHPIKGMLAKIVDFGLARAQDVSARLTQTGDLIGSPAYMSPEQCRAEGGDLRSDIYSLGALMYDVLAGQPPILGGTVFETIMLHGTQPPAPFAPDLDIPPWLQHTIFKMLEKDPGQRQQTVEEVLFELQAGISRALLGS